MDEIFKWVPVILFLTNLLMLWVAWSIKQVAASAGDSLRGLIAAHEMRLIHLEADVKAMPTSRDVQRLREDMGTLGSTVAALSQEVKGVGETSKTLQRGVEFLTQHMVEIGLK